MIAKADVMTHNFRPGVMEKIGLAYDDVQKINNKIIYAEITGYGKKGPWKSKPGQDLLVQALSGLAYTTGNKHDHSMPFGLSVADSMCGIHAVQGILAALIRRQKTGAGAYIELSLMESMLNFQFEILTTYYNTNKKIERSEVNNGNPLLDAPYGIYKTSDGHIALAMMNLEVLQDALGFNLLNGSDKFEFKNRDHVKRNIADMLIQKPSAYWIEKLKSFNLWASPVLDWEQMQSENAYKTLQMEQVLRTQNGSEIITTRCPININSKKLYSAKPAPLLGEHTNVIKKDLLNI